MRIIKCPVCDLDMKTLLVRGVEIDKCPECQGIWLDNEELDELIEKDKSEGIKSENLETENILELFKQEMLTKTQNS